ncbi:hypothetical protein ACW7G2_11605 [Luteimonas sp. A277]
MATSTERNLISRAVPPANVRHDGNLTVPRSFGVYELPAKSGSTRRYRLGNHPVRQAELHREFGACRLLYLFLQRPDAVQMASVLNAREA